MQNGLTNTLSLWGQQMMGRFHHLTLDANLELDPIPLNAATWQIETYRAISLAIEPSTRKSYHRTTSI